jgi:hypothetical protein
MRNLRPWHYLLFALPVVAIALGVQYVVRNNYPPSSNAELASVVKPSFFKPEKGAEEAPSRKGGKRKTKAEARQEAYAQPETEQLADADEPTSPGSRVSKKLVELAERYSRNERLDEPAAPVEGGPAARAVAGSAGPDSNVALSDKSCKSIEYRGDGLKLTKLTAADWEATMKQFRAAKEELLGWLAKRRKEVPDKTAQLMEEQLKRLRIQRPPTADEPDLSWRGIGVLTYTSPESPMIRAGSGLVKLVTKQPERAKFEMMRLVAQAWAPCELQKLDTGSIPWSPLLKCLNVADEGACPVGSYSEAGWAVSTALATAFAEPGCTVPALNNATAAACLKKIPLPLNASTADAANPASPLAAR